MENDSVAITTMESSSMDLYKTKEVFSENVNFRSTRLTRSATQLRIQKQTRRAVFSKSLDLGDIEDFQVCEGETVSLCTCQQSRSFPLCDGTHEIFNKETNSNLQPIRIILKEKEKETTSITSIVKEESSETSIETKEPDIDQGDELEKETSDVKKQTKKSLDKPSKLFSLSSFSPFQLLSFVKWTNDQYEQFIRKRRLPNIAQKMIVG